MMAVGVDSAVGNLAIAVSCRRLAAGQTPPLYQLLYYPAVDMGRDYPSWTLFGQGFGLDVGYADYVVPRVFGTRDLAQPEISQIGRAHVELQSLMRISYAVFCLKKKKTEKHYNI